MQPLEHKTRLLTSQKNEQNTLNKSIFYYTNQVIGFLAENISFLISEKLGQGLDKPKGEVSDFISSIVFVVVDFIWD